MVFSLPHSAAGTYTHLAYTQATPTHLMRAAAQPLTLILEGTRLDQLKRNPL